MAEKKDTIKDLSKTLRSVKAGDIMSKNVISARKDTALSEIAEIMISKRISGLPVLDDAEKIVGVITANDLFMVMDMVRSGDVPASGRNKDKEPNVMFAMSARVHKVKEDTSLEKIIILMKYKNAHTVPVMRGGKMVGVIGRRDVFKNFYATVKKLSL
jgi:CBS-domain-containing membrane protein